MWFYIAYMHPTCVARQFLIFLDPAALLQVCEPRREILREFPGGVSRAQTRLAGARTKTQVIAERKTATSISQYCHHAKVGLCQSKSCLGWIFSLPFDLKFEKSYMYACIKTEIVHTHHDSRRFHHPQLVETLL